MYSFFLWINPWSSSLLVLHLSFQADPIYSLWFWVLTTPSLYLWSKLFLLESNACKSKCSVDIFAHKSHRYLTLLISKTNFTRFLSKLETLSHNPYYLSAVPIYQLWWLIFFQLDWSKGCSFWENIISGCVCRCLWKWLALEWVKWVKKISLTTVGGLWPTSWGPEKNEKTQKGWCCSLLGRDSHLLLPSDIGTPGS